MVNQEEIKKIIPHRGDMLLLDEVRDYNDHSGVGIHYVKPTEFWCDGHFPSKPIMPGVLQVEALAQAACFIILGKLYKEDGHKRLGYFTTMEKIRFSHMVHPGDVLELHVELLASKMKLYKFHGIAMVSGMKVCEATFSAIMDEEINE
jgi:3-hydroxyacyl-[acyl-carrier-protein] dehydratase